MGVTSMLTVMLDTSALRPGPGPCLPGHLDSVLAGAVLGMLGPSSQWASILHGCCYLFAIRWQRHWPSLEASLRDLHNGNLQLPTDLCMVGKKMQSQTLLIEGLKLLCWGGAVVFRTGVTICHFCKVHLTGARSSGFISLLRFFSI